VVPVDDEGLDPRRVQAAQLAPEGQPGLHRAVPGVEQVPRQHQEAGLLPQAEVHHPGEGSKRRVRERVRPRAGVEAERRVEVQIGGVDEAETAHGRTLEDGPPTLCHRGG